MRDPLTSTGPEPGCPDCTAAAPAPQRHGLYRADCPGCATRRIARSPATHAVLCGMADAGPLTHALQTTFPLDQYRTARSKVWDWCQRLRPAPSAQAAP